MSAHRRWTSSAVSSPTGQRLRADAPAGWAAKYPEVEIVRVAIPAHPARLLSDASEHAARCPVAVVR